MFDNLRVHAQGGETFLCSAFWGSMAMAIREIIARGTYDADEIQILTESFELALRLSTTENRTSPQGLLLARRIIRLFESGERDSQTIANSAAATFGI